MHYGAMLSPSFLYPANGFTLFHRSTGSGNTHRKAATHQQRQGRRRQHLNLDVNNAGFKLIQKKKKKKKKSAMQTF